jgi:hypothetical protein
MAFEKEHTRAHTHPLSPPPPTHPPTHTHTCRLDALWPSHKEGPFEKEWVPAAAFAFDGV